MEDDYQSFRIAPDGDITRIEVFTDQDNGLRVVFWEDIESQYPGLHCVKNGDIAISFARDSNRRRLDPLCIKHQPGVVLDVVLASDSHAHIRHKAAYSHSANNSVSSLSIQSPGGSDTSSYALEYHTPPTGAFSHLANGTATESVSDHAAYLLPLNSPLVRSRSNSAAPPSLLGSIPVVLPTPMAAAANPTASTTAITTATTTTTVAVNKIQSTLLTSAHLFNHFEQSIKSGQLHQAESIKQEIRTAFGSLEAEMARNKELQLQMIELQKTAQEMQERMLTMQKQAIDRLAIIQSRVHAVLTQTYELHEYPIPRLFIVLPADTQRRDKVMSPFTTRFRLYFLCECGEHTKQQHGAFSQDQKTSSTETGVNGGNTHYKDSSGSKMTTHHIHLAKHEGYDLDRPNEFFRKYGSHILTLLQMLKYGIIAAGFVVPPLAQLGLVEGIDKTCGDLGSSASGEKGGLDPKVDLAIQYLEDLAHGLAETRNSWNAVDRDNNDNLDRGELPTANESSDTQTQGSLRGLEALEGADLRHLSTFLKIKDESRVLGNLYRIVTHEGHVKWVCLDHYRETYRDSSLKQFREAVESNGGSFEESKGKVKIRLSSSSTARQFLEALEQARFIQELTVALDWDTTMEDLRMLRDTLRKTNVVSLELDFCHHLGPSRDILNRHRRYDPILQIIANAKLQTLHLKRCDGFWSRMTKSIMAASSSPSPSSSSSSPVTPSELRLQCLDVDAMFETVKNATGGFRMLQTLHLMVNQAELQEHVDVEIAQPQQEIVSIRIESNKSLCTNLVYSGQVRRLVLYHEFDVAASQKINMKRIFERNRELHHFGTVCMVKDFVPILECLQAASAGHPALAYLELQDNARRNSVVMRPLLTDSSTTPDDSENKLKKSRVQLQLKGSDSVGREEILRALGWSLKKVPLGFQFTAGLARALVESMQSSGSVLQSLHANITDLKIDCLEPLATVIEISRETLTNVDVLLWAKAASYEGMLANTKALARFLVRISAQVTRLNLRAFGLSALLKELGLAATAAAEAAARTAAQATSLFPFASSTRRSITALPDNHYLRGDFAQGITNHGTNGVSVARSVTTVRKPAATAPPIVMSMLREFEIQPEADSSGKMIHCQINTPDLKWLSIPLSSPALKKVKLGYFDILTFGWTVVLQSLRFETLQVLVLEGTNFWDGQVKVLIECLEKTRARNGFWKAAPPQVHGIEVHVEEDNSNNKQGQQGGTSEGDVALYELTIKGSLISPPVLAGLETQVREIVPRCRVLTSGAK
ncbi:hypothetical protein BGZ70_002007 [Mortierella alpina]|uniref:Uncharacterized protein n=1 Tax=Mortierella alpina TaxID=64518 RepID=A0A9P6IV86_MORAP|nr:hypothetical protein BGZ70_002007 [Mortierella alpina]